MFSFRLCLNVLTLQNEEKLVLAIVVVDDGYMES